MTLRRTLLIALVSLGLAAPLASAKPSLTLTHCPRSMYANATAAMPVTFEVEDFGKAVTVRNLRVRLLLNKKLGFEYVADKTFSQNDGMDPLKNGSSNRYTLWIPINDTTFRAPSCLVEGKQTRDVAIEVTAEVSSPGRPPVTLSALAEKHHNKGGMRISFYDKRFDVIEIGIQAVGQSERLTLNHNQPATRRVEFVGKDERGIPTYTVYKSEAELADPAALGDLGFFQQRLTRKKEKNAIELDCQLSVNPWFAGISSESQTRPIRAIAGDETLGVQFGVSFPHLKITPAVLSALYGEKARGMDIRTDMGQAAAMAFPNFTTTLHVEQTRSPAWWWLIVGVAVMGLLTAWAIWKKRLGMVLSSGVALAGLWVVAASPATRYSASASIHGFYSVRMPGQSRPGTVRVFTTKISRRMASPFFLTKSNFAPMAIAKTGLFTAGDTWTYFIRAQVSISREAPKGWFSPGGKLKAHVEFISNGQYLDGPRILSVLLQPYYSHERRGREYRTSQMR